MLASVLDREPWYKHRWAWLLMLGPFVAMLGCALTIWLAYDHPDGTIALDYYKRGLAVNQDIRRQTASAQMGMSAHLSYGKEDGLFVVHLSGKSRPHTLQLKLIHPTQNGFDRSLTLIRENDGEVGEALYRAATPLPREVEQLPIRQWYVSLETADWRLDGVWHVGMQETLMKSNPSLSPAE